MIKKNSILLFLMVFFLSVSAQNHTDSIKIVKIPGGGTRYEQLGKDLKLYQIEYIMNKNPMAVNDLKKAKSLDVFTNIVASCGGGLLGYALGYGLSSGYYEMTLITVGCGFIVIAIPISLAAKNKLDKAIETYNGGLIPQSSYEKPDLKFGVTPNGIGFTLTL